MPQEDVEFRPRFSIEKHEQVVSLSYLLQSEGFPLDELYAVFEEKIITYQSFRIKEPSRWRNPDEQFINFVTNYFVLIQL